MRNAILFTLLIFSQVSYSQKTSVTKKVVDSTHWIYEVDTDEMTSEKIPIATVYAHDKVYLKFPYNTGVKAYIYVRNKHGENNFWFAVSHGFIGSLGGNSVDARLRFDDEEPISYTFSFSTDRDKKRIAATDEVAENIIKRLKKAKRLRIEVPFLGDDEIVEFNVTGLKWDYEDKTLAKQKEEEKPGWKYTADTDKMTSSICYKANINATAKLFFKSPYEGGSMPRLYLQYNEGQNCFAYIIKNGSFSKNPTGNATVRIRFDEEQPSYYTFYFADNETDALAVFGIEASKLIEKVKKATRIRIEATFEKDDNEITDFNVAGLKWYHKDKPSVDSATMQNWHYSNDTDKMTSVINYHSYAASGKSHDNGVSYFLVDNIDSVNYISIELYKGAFKEESPGSTMIKLRFDDEQPQYYRFWFPRAIHPNNTRKEIVFITYPYVDNLIAKIKAAKKVRVQADYVDEDGIISEFNVAGLKWNHKGKTVDTTKFIKTMPEEVNTDKSAISVKVNVITTQTSDDNGNLSSSLNDTVNLTPYLNNPNFQKLKNKYIKESYEDSFEKKYKITTKSTTISKIKFLSPENYYLSIFSVNDDIFIDVTGIYGGPLLINPGDKFIFLLNNNNTVECSSVEVQQNHPQGEGIFSHEFIFYASADKISQLKDGFKSCRFFTTSGYIDIFPPSSTNVPDIVKAFLGEFAAHKKQMGN